jgi:hypothetical protein
VRRSLGVLGAHWRRGARHRGWFGGRLAFAWVKNETGWLRIQKVEVSGSIRLSKPTC